MMFWQLTIDANDPALLARFGRRRWATSRCRRDCQRRLARALPHPAGRLCLAFNDRILDPAGLRPPIWFQQVPEEKAERNRPHLDLFPTGRDNALPMQRRIETIEAKAAELIRQGATVERRTQHDDPEDPIYAVVMHDPEGNEFCIS